LREIHVKDQSALPLLTFSEQAIAVNLKVCKAWFVYIFPDFTDSKFDPVLCLTGFHSFSFSELFHKSGSWCTIHYVYDRMKPSGRDVPDRLFRLFSIFLLKLKQELFGD
jgi:hypothetical protein